MSDRKLQEEHEDDSPVGDVRRVRKQLSERFGNDVRRLGEYARKVGEQAQHDLGCATIRKPAASAR